MQITPRGDWITLEQLEPPDKIGGLHLSAGAQEAHRRRPVGMVLEVGPEVNAPESGNEPIEKNDVLIFDEMYGKKIEGNDGRIVYMVRAERVIGHVKSDRHATTEEVAALKARAAAVRAEQESASNNVIVAP